MKKLFFFFLIYLIVAPFNSAQKTGNGYNPEIDSLELKSYITYLASDQLKGRFTGTKEMDLAAEYIALKFKEAGLTPYFKGTYYQEFPFISGIELSKKNSFTIKSGKKKFSYKLNSDYTPAPFSGNVKVKGEIVFAGYGISAPKLKYDDYDGLDVKGKIVMVMRYHPEYDNPHSEFEEFASYRGKAATAKEKGAAGIIFFTPPSPKDDEDKLIKFVYDRAPGLKDFAVIHLKRDFASQILANAGFDAKKLQDSIYSSKKPVSFLLKNTSAEIVTGIDEINKTGKNVAGLIEGSDEKLKNEYIIIGAHFDHLGMGQEGSLYRGSEPQIHNGADDNASGTSGLIELAQKLSAERKNIKRSIVIVGFSGEELGLLGSAYFANNPPLDAEKYVTMINMDMIGRLNEEKNLIVYGTGTSKSWKDILNELNKENFKLTFNDEGFGPSDHSSFYAKNIPVLFFFTGTHSDYHRPSDDAELINYTGLTQILNYVHSVTVTISNLETKPDYVNVPRKDGGRAMSAWKVYVGTIPDYAYNGEGLKITGASEGSPAQKGGMLAGDIMVKFGGRKINNIYDYVYALKEFVPGDIVEVEVKRGEELLTLSLTLTAR